MDSLIPEERVVYEKILYADKKLGGEYKGKSKQFKSTSLKRVRTILRKKCLRMTSMISSQDEDYTSNFIKKNRPSFSRADEDKAYRERDP